MTAQFELRTQSLVAFVPTRHPDLAKIFYRDALGLQLVSEELPFALVFDAGGIMLRVTIVEDLTPARYTVLGWQVPDVAEGAKALRKAGVRFEHYQGMQQDELDVWTSPSGARIAWFKDPDGNTLSISEHASNRAVS